METILGLGVLAFLFFWLATHENTRTKHEALSLMFFFFGFFIVIVDFMAMAQESRALTYYGLEGMVMVLMQITVLMLVFTLFYFMLKYASAIFAFLKNSLNGSGRDNDE